MLAYRHWKAKTCLLIYPLSPCLCNYIIYPIIRELSFQTHYRMQNVLPLLVRIVSYVRLGCVCTIPFTHSNLSYPLARRGVLPHHPDQVPLKVHEVPFDLAQALVVGAARPGKHVHQRVPVGTGLGYRTVKYLGDGLVAAAVAFYVVGTGCRQQFVIVGQGYGMRQAVIKV